MAHIAGSVTNVIQKTACRAVHGVSPSIREKENNM